MNALLSHAKMEEHVKTLLMSTSVNVPKAMLDKTVKQVRDFFRGLFTVQFISLGVEMMGGIEKKLEPVYIRRNQALVVDAFEMLLRKILA